MSAGKKYLVQQIFIDNFGRVLDSYEIGVGRIVNHSHTLVASFCIASSWTSRSPCNSTSSFITGFQWSSRDFRLISWSRSGRPRMNLGWQNSQVWSWLEGEIYMEAWRRKGVNKKWEAKGDEKFTRLLTWKPYIFNWRTKLENCHYQMRIIWVRDPNDKGATWRKYSKHAVNNKDSRYCGGR